MGRCIKLLLVEDNADDALFFGLGVKKASANLVHVPDAEKAIEHLTNEPAPDTIVLDLVLPGMSIHRFLEWFRATPRLHHVPIVIHTGAVNVPEDVKQVARKTFFKSVDLAKTLQTVFEILTLAESSPSASA